MARLIVKSPYFKGGGAKPAGGYLRYIATRERVEILPDDRPPTKRQTQLIEKLTKDFPDTKTLLEYGDYTSHPTKFNASQFLTLAMEENWGKVQKIDGYAKYIATRPRAERLGEHGLFGDEDAVDLNAAMAEVNDYTGNIWTHIISLRREDAERLGFDHADAWRALLRAHRNDIAEAVHIPPEDFCWYAAFHDEGGHPHVHMMAWSKKPGQAYLNREGIRKIKSVLTNQIFQQELLHIYEDKSQSRGELVRETRSAMLLLAQKMQNSACEHPEAEQMIRELALELVDVDVFKAVNDTFGHGIGDQILRKVASVLKKQFRNIDYVCRIGGDEFAVIMVNSASDKRCTIKKKIEEANEELSNPTDSLPAVSLSVGVAFSGRKNPKGSISNDADTALYYIKEHGRHNCGFYE